LNDFTLNQNYPNPFNPSTKISFSIPKSGYTSLKIYDVLGNEVAKLVDEYREAGKYEVEFNPESSIKNFPAGRQSTASGVYFYQLTIGNIVQSKKMLMIK
jgi:Secretion system C-terminal sorting domain